MLSDKIEQLGTRAGLRFAATLEDLNMTCNCMSLHICASNHVTRPIGMHWRRMMAAHDEGRVVRFAVA